MGACHDRRVAQERDSERDVLTSLPRTRPVRRSAKRDAIKPRATATPPAASTPKSTAAAKPNTTAKAKPAPRAAAAKPLPVPHPGPGPGPCHRRDTPPPHATTPITSAPENSS